MTDLESINASNLRIRELVMGRWRDQIPPTVPVFTWCDVRDVALAHVRAMTRPDAGGKRFYIVGGHFSNARLAEIIQRTHPQLVKEGKLPEVKKVAATGGSGGGAEGGRLMNDDLPEDVYQFDVSRSRTVLGLEYRDLETCIRDTVASILERLPSKSTAAA